jgi:hypothetical protein
MMLVSSKYTSEVHQRRFLSLTSERDLTMVWI